MKEVELLETRGFSIRERLTVSPAAQLIMPYHALIDSAREEALGGKKLERQDEALVLRMKTR